MKKYVLCIHDWGKPEYYRALFSITNSWVTCRVCGCKWFAWGKQPVGIIGFVEEDNKSK